MMLRDSLISLVNDGKYQTTSYDGWEKRAYPVVLDTLGYEKGLVMYVNQETNVSFYIEFSYGVPSLNLYVPVFSESGFTKLYADLQDIDKREENVKSLRWSTRYCMDYCTHIGETEDKIINDLMVDSNGISNIGLLNSSIDVLSSAIQFSANMLEDIKNESKKYFLPQEKVLWKLTNSLVNNYEEEITKIHEIFYFDPLNGSRREAMRWIKDLKEQGYLYEALLWCNTFTKEHREHYSRALEMAKEILMQIESLKEKGTEYVFPLGDNGRDLSYKESIFKIAWKIAESSVLEDDKTLAARFLNEISGQPNFVFGETLPKFSSADLLINQAKILKKLSDKNNALLEENIDLKERIKALESNHSRASQLGVFGKPQNNTNTNRAAIEETNKYSC